MGGLMGNRNNGTAASRLAVWLVAVSLVFLGAIAGCTTTTTTRTTTRTVAQVDPSATQSKKPKQDASGKHRHEHCHIKGNGKNEVCHDHPHDDGTHH